MATQFPDGDEFAEQQRQARARVAAARGVDPSVIDQEIEEFTQRMRDNDPYALLDSEEPASTFRVNYNLLGPAPKMIVCLRDAKNANALAEAIFAETKEGSFLVDAVFGEATRPVILFAAAIQSIEIFPQERSSAEVRTGLIRAMNGR